MIWISSLSTEVLRQINSTCFKQSGSCWQFIILAQVSHSILFQSHIFVTNSLHWCYWETLQSFWYNIKQLKMNIAVKKQLAIAYWNCTTLSRYNHNNTNVCKARKWNSPEKFLVFDIEITNALPYISNNLSYFSSFLSHNTMSIKEPTWSKKPEHVLVIIIL